MARVVILLRLPPLAHCDAALKLREYCARILAPALP
jgi:hypothetical protein